MNPQTEWEIDNAIAEFGFGCSACGHDEHGSDCPWDVLFKGNVWLQCHCDGESGLVYISDERIPESDPRFPWKRDEA